MLAAVPAAGMLVGTPCAAAQTLASAPISTQYTASQQPETRPAARAPSRAAAGANPDTADALNSTDDSTRQAALRALAAREVAAEAAARHGNATAGTQTRGTEGSSRGRGDAASTGIAPEVPVQSGSTGTSAARANPLHNTLSLAGPPHRAGGVGNGTEAAPVPNLNVQAPKGLAVDAPDSYAPSVAPTIMESRPTPDGFNSSEYSQRMNRLFAPSPGAVLTLPFSYDK